MKLLIFADTHNSPFHMLEVVGEETGVHAVIHLGDGFRDAEILQQKYPHLPVYSVCGNCDLACLGPEEGLIPFGGLLLYYTHGHIQGVKQEYTTLWRTAKKRGADIALFGHTHMPYHKYNGGIHLFNPGSLNMPRSGRGSYGTLVIENGRPEFDFCGYHSEKPLIIQEE